MDLYCYDKDFLILVSFFKENLTECAQTVLSTAKWEVSNMNIWMFLDIWIEQCVAKFF